MRRRPAPVLALVLSSAVLAGCSGARDLPRDAIDMSPWNETGDAADRVAALEPDAADRLDDRADAREDARQDAQEAADERAEEAREELEDCGDPDDARELELSAGGAEMVVVVPAEDDDDAVEELEDYREDADAGPVCWVVVRVDNTEGDQVVDLPRVEVVTADGRQVRLERASDALSGWADRRADDDDAAVRAVELTAGLTGVVGPGDEGDVVFVAATDLDDPRGVRLQPADGAPLVDASS
ncbi:hypothetical protein [uncultured Pseudokineococcus sp.]|uniref:hypothetical protein n=1 Tax=uncultured Pseudokineococcus sp. TaxID=1642928 RepID=UPI00261A52E7|nr:hypothetical protein [uncultured Pseudokineococcus sp.]